MRRCHAISLGFSGHYQDLELATTKLQAGSTAKLGARAHLHQHVACLTRGGRRWNANGSSLDIPETCAGYNDWEYGLKNG